MKTGLDTSVVVRVLTEDPPEQAAAAATWIAERRGQGLAPWVSDLVVAEAYFALQTHYGVPQKEALAALRQFLESGDVTPIGRSLDVLRSLDQPASAKPGFVDRMIHAEVLSKGGKLATFEKSAAKLKDSIVLGKGTD